MSIHLLKCWPTFYAEIVAGVKTFEVRRNDRDFRVGDLILLQEFNPEASEWTGNTYPVKIKYRLSPENPCAVSREAITKGFCVLGIEPFAQSDFNSLCRQFLSREHGEASEGDYPDLEILFSFLERTRP